MRAMRDGLWDRLQSAFPSGSLRLNGPADPALRLPNTLSVGIRGLNAAALLTALQEELAASAGAACHSGSGGMSSVLW